MCLWNIPTAFPDEGYKFDKLGSFACDEAFSIMISDYTALDYVQGNITPTNLRAFNIWNSMYIIVRKVNTVLANMDKATDLVGREKKELTGYLYFMRAYAYYRLITYYGPIVILDDNVMETNESEEYYDLPRSTFDESVDYVCGELEKAAELMPGGLGSPQNLRGLETVDRRGELRVTTVRRAQMGRGGRGVQADHRLGYILVAHGQ